MGGDRLDLLARIQELEEENKVLRERETPKKVTVDTKYNTHCPVCGEIQVFGYYDVNNKYCTSCGQALDWSDDQ